tara:strand:+ start:22311 stop:23507 length:1197 start_codon:yes stop_codon:yes gene_type:complete
MNPEEKSESSVGIIGGGISGLSAALVLAKHKISCELIEKNTMHYSLGAGVQLGPNATRALANLDVLPNLLEKAFLPKKMLVYDMRSRFPLTSLEIRDRFSKKYKFPYLTMLRTDLHEALTQKTKEFSQIKKSYSTKVIKVKTTSSKKIVISTKSTSVFSALVLSDGISSPLGQKLGFLKKPNFSNISIFRSIIRNPKSCCAEIHENISLWLGKNCHVVTYPVNQTGSINIVIAVKNEPEKTVLNRGQVLSLDAFSHFIDIKCDALQEIIEQGADWYEWPVYQGRRIKQTSDFQRNAIVLLGDAGHPLKPHLAQGASMALEDSMVLDKFLLNEQKPRDWQRIFEEYAASRILRIKLVQNRSARNGKIFHFAEPIRTLRNFTLKMFGGLLLDQRWLYKKI